MVRGVRVVLVFLVVIFCIFQTTFVLYKSAHVTHKIQTMAVEGAVSFCINYPPNITSVCSGEINQSTLVQNNSLRCQMNATAVSGSELNFSVGGTYNGTTVEYVPIDFNMIGMKFLLNSSGFLYIEGNQSGIGEYYVPILVRDTSACPMQSIHDYAFIIYDINDPPTLFRLLPSKSIAGKSTIMPFFLRDYFRDLDNDNMTYSYYNYNQSSELFVLIDNETTQVRITAVEGVCEEQNLHFTATDVHNASTDSNIVTIDITCEPEKPEESNEGAGGPKCDEEWHCKDWSRCFINSTQFRECVDLHACDPDNIRKDFWRDCVYIPTCYDGVQNAGETGVDCGGPCPACSVEEIIKNETCDDGIKNQGELGVDCGGPCPACKQVEVPGLLPEDEYSNNLMTIVMVVILSSGAMVVTYFIFRKEIKRFVAKVAWWFTRKKRKQILLKDEEREELLSRIKALEIKAKKINESIMSSNKSFQEFLDISRVYFDYSLSLKSFLDVDVDLSLKKVKNSNLVKAMKVFIQRQVEFEKSEVTLDRELVLYYIQDLRQLVLNTSNYDKKDYSFAARTLPVEDEIALEKGKALLYNATVALEFSDVDSAEESYFELLKVYELLDDEGKELLFYELNKLFNYIKYTISWKKLENNPFIK